MPALKILILFFCSLTVVSILEASETKAPIDARSNFEANAGSNRFYIKATGDLAYENTFVIPKRTSTQEVFWTCSGDALRIGYAWGPLGQPGWENLVLVVETPVAAGQTGTFAMSGLIWTYGQEPMPGQPADSKFKVPRGFEGSGGELTLDTHTADNKSQRRIQGVAEGQVKAKNSDLTVQLYVEFDLNKACK